MAVTLVATPGAANANSYLTLAEATAYFETRLPIPEWDEVDSQEGMLIMATRLMESMYSPMRKLVRVQPPGQSYYLIRPTWTGSPASSTQRLAWPRLGMYDRNGNAIASTVIPQELKDATAELAGQLAKGDRTLDSDASIQGLSSIRAGSVSLSFKDAFDATKVIPDIVFGLLVPSWLTDEIMEFANQAEFMVVSE
jgi:hypothetical protein